jgi:hypothetical protein
VLYARSNCSVIVVVMHENSGVEVLPSILSEVGTLYYMEYVMCMLLDCMTDA